MRYVLEFESAEEMQATLELLKNPAAAERPEMSLVNRMPQSVLLLAKPAADGIEIEIHPRGTQDEGKQLGPGERFLLG